MFMNRKDRVRQAIDYRSATVRARIRNERNLAGWKRDQRTPLPVGTQLPVIFCTWHRLGRLPRTLDLLAGQDVAVQAFIWNNSPDRAAVDAAAGRARVPVTVHHSPRNIGGFGRFYLAREAAAAGHAVVVFIDDDQDFGPAAIGDLVRYHRPRSLSGWWAFEFRGAGYGDRVPALPGERASYIGTGGMVADAAVFRDSRLFRCPRRFWFVEDLWLCYFAERLAGFELYKSPAQFELAEDGRDQYLSLGRTKWNFLRYLMRQGWEPVRRDGAPGGLAGTGAGLPGEVGLG
jgi:hypothetical protein